MKVKYFTEKDTESLINKSDTYESSSSESSSHSAPYLQLLHLVSFLLESVPDPSSSTKH